MYMLHACICTCVHECGHLWHYTDNFIYAVTCITHSKVSTTRSTEPLGWGLEWGGVNRGTLSLSCCYPSEYIIRWDRSRLTCWRWGWLGMCMCTCTCIHVLCCVLSMDGMMRMYMYTRFYPYTHRTWTYYILPVVPWLAEPLPLPPAGSTCWCDHQRRKCWWWLGCGDTSELQRSTER